MPSRLLMGVVVIAVLTGIGVAVLADSDDPPPPEVTPSIRAPSVAPPSVTAQPPAQVRALLGSELDQAIETECKKPPRKGGLFSEFAIVGPPRFACVITLKSGREVRFLKIKDHWIRVPRGVVL